MAPCHRPGEECDCGLFDGAEEGEAAETPAASTSQQQAAPAEEEKEGQRCLTFSDFADSQRVPLQAPDGCEAVTKDGGVVKQVLRPGDGAVPSLHARCLGR